MTTTLKTNTDWRSSFKTALILFIVFRILFTLWAGLATTLIPIPDEPDEEVRPYLGAIPLDNILLSPWQRFDTNRYVRIADVGYANEEDSVFPPLYPMLIRGVGWVLRGGQVGTEESRTVSLMIAGILISNLATIGTFTLLHALAQEKLGAEHASRTTLYFAIFPTSFFLFGVYTESLFIFLALGAMMLGGRRKLWNAGILAFFATLTRTTGVGLVLPLAWFVWQKLEIGDWRLTKRSDNLQSLIPNLIPLSFPIFGFLGFLGIRWWLEMPAINTIYAQYWHQTTSIPGRDLLTALQIMFSGNGVRAGEFTLYFDFLIALLLIATTIYAFRRYGMAYGLYCLALLGFMLLPRSDLKPIYSFSRYALAFFPLFLWAGNATKRNAITHRLILYPSFILLLYLSGQFFIWGWVA